MQNGRKLLTSGEMSSWRSDSILVTQLSRIHVEENHRWTQMNTDSKGGESTFASRWFRPPFGSRNSTARKQSLELFLSVLICVHLWF